MRTFGPKFDAIFDEPDPLDAVDALNILAADPVPFSAEMGISARSARQAIRALAARGGYAPDALREWSSADAPGTASVCQPAMYYAALLPSTAADEMPLGLGATAAEALGDLLWALGAPVLLDALADDDDPEPIWDDALAGDLADEFARSGLW